jgi:hypothetical protein
MPPLWASTALHGSILDTKATGTKFDLNADPDPPFSLLEIRIKLPKIMRIRIRNPDNNVPESDPDPYRMIFCLLDPDPLLQGTDPDLAPDPLSIKQN